MREEKKKRERKGRDKKRREVACEKGADRWSLEITGWSNICIATDDESRRAAVISPTEEGYNSLGSGCGSTIFAPSIRGNKEACFDCVPRILSHN